MQERERDQEEKQRQEPGQYSFPVSQMNFKNTRLQTYSQSVSQPASQPASQTNDKDPCRMMMAKQHVAINSFNMLLLTNLGSH